MNEWTDIVLDEDVCVENCPLWGELALPEDPNCCPLLELGQICGVYLDPCCLNPMFRYTPERILEWSLGIDNSDTTGKALKYLVVEGSKGQPDNTVVDLPKGLSKISKRTFTIDLEIKCETLDLNTSEEGPTVNSSGLIDKFMRTQQKGNLNFCFWYETLGGYFYGDRFGIKPSFVDAWVDHQNDKESIRTWNWQIQFESLCDPIRILNPIA